MSRLNRRALLAGLTLIAAQPYRAYGEDQPPAKTVYWKDLVPETEGEGTFIETLRDLNLIQQGETLPWRKQPPVGMVSDFNERRVRIPGYVVPLTLDGEGVTEGLLVPYVGACIHVPPPPANQIVFLRFEKPTPQDGLWDPVWATGRFNMAAVETDLAEAGYVMTETATEPYTG
ncbi:MAG: DUF3299 domain-containing protein [Paracoccaceae bacterium]|jgi:hypothetical protein|nr:DUF3299 domain-containing protein [Paracoccaceae bacterium]MDG1371074.1 DUF3299 domain-containing protein [Paracoccaceae bacterium]